jgi:DNA-binding CsgD family transcriptional regulator
MIQNLSSLLDLTREEREECVVGLYKDGKTTREIAKLMRMSLRDIGAILKKLKLQAERERGGYMNDDEVDMESKSKEAQAFKLLSEGKSPLDISIKLDIDASRVRAILRDYYELEGMHDLAEIYNDLGDNTLFQIIMISQICRAKRMSAQDIRKALELAKLGELERLQLKVEYLYHDANRLEQKISILNRKKYELQAFLEQDLKKAEMACRSGYYMFTNALFLNIWRCVWQFLQISKFLYFHTCFVYFHPIVLYSYRLACGHSVVQMSYHTMLYCQKRWAYKYS